MSREGGYSLDVSSSEKRGDEALRKGNFLEAYNQYWIATSLADETGDRREVERIGGKARRVLLSDKENRVRKIINGDKLLERLDLFITLSAERSARGTETPFLLRAHRSYPVILLLAGIFLIFLGKLNSNINLSPGESLFNWKLWIGIILIILGVILRYFWNRKNKQSSKKKISRSIKYKRKKSRR